MDINWLPEDVAAALSQPLHACDEAHVTERLDHVFNRWSGAYSFTHLGTLKLMNNKGEGGTVHMWHILCSLSVTPDGGETRLISAPFIGPSDERGTFSPHTRAAFLSAAVRKLGAGHSGRLRGDSLLTSCPGLFPLYLVRFSAPLDSIEVNTSDEERSSFLDYRPLAIDYIRIYRMEPVLVKYRDTVRRCQFYILTADQRGFVVLSAQPLPDRCPFEMTIESHKSYTFSVDSVQRKRGDEGVDLCIVNFERFLPSAIFESLKDLWGTERREHVRLERSLPMEIELSRHRKLYGITDNISLVGARIVHTHTIPPGIYFDCRIRLGGAGGDIMFRGTMVWKTNLMANLNMTGIKIIDMGENDGRRLKQYMHSEITADLKKASAPLQERP